MMGTSGGGAGGAALSAVFDTRDDARAAARRLIDAGLPPGDVRVIPEDPEVEAEGRDVGTEGGFLGALVSLFFPRDDHDTYAEALRRGGILVVAERVPPELQDAALEALDLEGAVDLEGQAETWRAEGWTAPEAGAAPDATLRRDASGGRGRVRSYRSE